MIHMIQLDYQNILKVIQEHEKAFSKITLVLEIDGVFRSVQYNVNPKSNGEISISTEEVNNDPDQIFHYRHRTPSSGEYKELKKKLHFGTVKRAVIIVPKYDTTVFVCTEKDYIAAYSEAAQVTLIQGTWCFSTPNTAASLTGTTHKCSSIQQEELYFQYQTSEIEFCNSIEEIEKALDYLLEKGAIRVQ